MVAEFDPERVPSMTAEVLALAAGTVERCTVAPRDVIEEAKRGYDMRLKPLLRASPVGSLVRVPLTLCSERGWCSMYDPNKCTTRNIKRNGGDFPGCWEADTDEKARGLCTAIVHAWRQGYYPIIVSPAAS
jgi:hypothetical protein